MPSDLCLETMAKQCKLVADSRLKDKGGGGEIPQFVGFALFKHKAEISMSRVTFAKGRW